MKYKVYIETTIPSYLAARPSRDLLVAAHQQITQEWWDTRASVFDLYISDLVLEEARAGDPTLALRRLEVLRDIPVLHSSSEIMQLAGNLVNEGPIPQNAAGDAIHIAAATIYGCDYLLTWNCRHIANAELQRAARQLARRLGYELPVICTPEELMGDEA